MKQGNTVELGNRIKGYEEEPMISPQDHMIIRIDGHHFFKIYQGFR